MVVFFDIDGTLVDDATQQIPPSAAAAIEALNRRGHIPVVNTGRPFYHIDPRIRALPFQAWICGCGMQVRLNDNWLINASPDEDLCRRVVELVRQCQISVLYEGEKELYSDGKWSLCPQVVTESVRMQKKGFRTREISSLPQPRFLKFVTFDRPGSDGARLEQALAPYFDCIDRGGGMREFMLKGYSKAGGMERLLSHLRISREDTLAVGDSTNDLPMFLAAGHTAAMGNAMAQLKEHAEFVSTSVLEDGIAAALSHFGLI